jgi:type IV pilus assembly protein PilW
MKKPPAFKKQLGLSLVELMISITISLVIMAGVIQLYANSTRTSATAQGASRIQENVRYVMGRLSRDIARAGNMGCFSFAAAGAPQAPGTGGAQAGGVYYIEKFVRSLLANRLSVQVDPADPALTYVVNETSTVAAPDDTLWSDFENSFISGENNNNTADVVLDTTDTLVVKFVDSTAAIPINAATDTTLTLDNVTGLEDGDIVFAGDCKQMSVVTLSNDVEDGNNTVSIVSDLTLDITPSPMSYLYAGDSGAYRYYVGGVNCASAGVNRQNCSLYRSFNGGDAQELVKGIHDFQISYGHEGLSDDSVATNGRLTVDRVQISMDFNAVDNTQPGNLLTKRITRVFAIRNQL